MPHVTRNHHPADAHEESHEYIDRIVVQQPETALDSAAWLVTSLVGWVTRTRHEHLFPVNSVVFKPKAKGKLTFFPPLPSTTLPVLPSTTLAWNQPPRALSRTLPSPPHMETAMTQQTFSCQPQPFPPSKPGLLPKTLPRTDVSAEQNGIRITDVRATTKAPAKPASVPTSETPPFVPGGTWRKFQDVRSRGLLLERMPSSEEKVSAATAA